MNKSFFLFVTKVFVTALVIYLLSRNLDINQVKDSLYSVPSTTLLYSLILIWLNLAICAVRWQKILACRDSNVPFKDLWHIVTVGFSLSQFLPSSVGGDVYRGFQIKRYGLSTSWSVGSILIDRLYGLFGMILVAFMALSFQIDILLHSYLGWIILISTVMLFGGIGFLWALQYLPDAKFRFLKTLKEFSADIRMTLKNPIAVVVIILISMIAITLFIIPVFLLSQAMGLPLTFLQILTGVPVVFLVSALPLSFAGWGLREGAMVIVFAAYGIPKEISLALSLMLGTLQLMAAVPGLLLCLFNRQRPKLASLQQ